MLRGEESADDALYLESTTDLLFRGMMSGDNDSNESHIKQTTSALCNGFSTDGERK
jgi:hypothetical protein